jgi:hypothetical protein
MKIPTLKAIKSSLANCFILSYELIKELKYKSLFIDVGIFLSSKKLLNIFLISLLIILLIYVYIEDFNNIVVNQFISTIDYDIFIIPFFIFYTWFIIHSLKLLLRNYHFHPAWTYIYLVLAAIYIYFRFIDTEVYLFYEFSFTSIKIVDFLVFLLVPILFQIIRRDIWGELKNYYPTTINKKYNFFLEDNPIDENIPDIFEWGNHAELLVNKIVDTNVKKSFTIGIVAEWGAGKSSFYYLIKNCIIDKKLSNIHIIDFNAWYNNDPKLIVEEFLITLKKELKKYDGSLNNEIKEYAKSLTKVSNEKFYRLIDSGINILSKQENAAMHYENINKLLKQLNHKLLIFIDDLDRLTSAEIIEVLRIIRNTSNFYNTFFVLGYDRGYIDNATSEINKYGSNRYLDKIVQYEMSLPLYKKGVIKDFLLQNLLSGDFSLDKLFSISDASPRNIYDLDFVEYFNNLREVKRFINIFRIEYSNKYKNTDPYDLILVTILKFKFYKYWDYISDEAKFSNIMDIIEKKCRHADITHL